MPSVVQQFYEITQSDVQERQLKMIWALAAFLANIVEQLLITSVIREMNPIVYVALFYLFSIAFLILYHFIFKRREQFFDWHKALKHKFLVLGFAGGAFVGNALWFTSIYLIGVGMTGFLLVFIRVIVTVYAYLYMKDRFPLDKAIAFGLGIIMLLFFSLSDGASNILGITAALISCFGFAMEGISRKKLAEHDARPENMMLFRNSFLFLLSWSALGIAIMINHVEVGSVFALDVRSLFFIMVAAFLGGLIVNMFVFYAMRHIKLSQYQALETTKPVFLALSGVMILGEDIALVQALCGGAIILSALYFLVPLKLPIKRNIP